MYMAYTTNPKLPRLRMEMANLVLREGWSTVQVARYSGYSQSTIVRWVAKAKATNLRTIPTESSRPHQHPHKLDQQIVQRILALREERQQCAEILHHRLEQEGVLVSLSSVKRTLKRYGRTRFSQWKKWHIYPERLLPQNPGILTQIDTIHCGAHHERLYIYTFIDVCTRWAWAMPLERISTHASWQFVKQIQQRTPFTLQCIQTDHGPEFTKWFTKQCVHNNIAHRHSRVRKPTDNGHVERFNRTIQQECLRRIPRSLKSWKKEIPLYMHYYNTERPHMGLAMKTPQETMRSY